MAFDMNKSRFKIELMYYIMILLCVEHFQSPTVRWRLISDHIQAFSRLKIEDRQYKKCEGYLNFPFAFLNKPIQ